MYYIYLGRKTFSCQNTIFAISMHQDTQTEIPQHIGLNMDNILCYLGILKHKDTQMHPMGLKF